MDQGLRDWLALALVLVLLGLVSSWFSRQTFRLVTLLAVGAGVAAVTAYGTNLGGRPASYLAALQAGGNRLATEMFGHLMPDRVRGTLVPGVAGWLALLVVTGGLLVAFDALAARRLPPGVQVGDVPQPAPGSPPVGQQPSGLALRRFVTEELKFRLPAAQVRAPGSMPGGSTLESLATVVSDSGVQGSKVTAALMLTVTGGPAAGAAALVAPPPAAPVGGHGRTGERRCPAEPAPAAAAGGRAAGGRAGPGPPPAAPQPGTGGGPGLAVRHGAVAGAV